MRTREPGIKFTLMLLAVIVTLSLIAAALDR